MEALAGRDQSQTAPQMLTAPGERRIVGGGEVEAHHPEQGVQEPFGLAQREMGEETQGQGGLDGEIRVPPPGHPHRHIATSNEGPVVGRSVRHAIFRLVRGMDLRLNLCSVAPAAGHEKCRPHRPTPPAGSSCNNATRRYRGAVDAVELRFSARKELLDRVPLCGIDTQPVFQLDLDHPLREPRAVSGRHPFGSVTVTFSDRFTVGSAIVRLSRSLAMSRR